MKPALVVKVFFVLVGSVQVSHHHVSSPHTDLTLALRIRVEEPVVN
jgi:hypothetical protein